jgi:aspartate/tyrosine/aromatic aminotransferase
MPRFPGFTPAVPDPIFDLMRQARLAGPGAIDATVGAILDAEGLPLLFDCVRNAMEEWTATLARLGRYLDRLS